MGKAMSAAINFKQVFIVFGVVYNEKQNLFQKILNFMISISVLRKLCFNKGVSDKGVFYVLQTKFKVTIDDSMENNGSKVVYFRYD